MEKTIANLLEYLYFEQWIIIISSLKSKVLFRGKVKDVPDDLMNKLVILSNTEMDFGKIALIIEIR